MQASWLWWQKLVTPERLLAGLSDIIFLSPGASDLQMALLIQIATYGYINQPSRLYDNNLRNALMATSQPARR